MIRPQRRNAGCCIKASYEIDFRILPFLHSVLENIGRRYRHSDSADYGLVSISDRGQRVQQDLSDLKYNLRFLRLGAYALGALLALSPEISRADESGVSFWLPGQVDSLPAVPGVPGWSLGAVYYHTTVSAFGAVAAAREIQIGRFSPTVKFARASRSHLVESNLYVRKPGARRAIFDGCHRSIRPIGRHHRRDIDHRYRSICRNAYGKHFRFDHISRRSVSDDDTEVELRRS